MNVFARRITLGLLTAATACARPAAQVSAPASTIIVIARATSAPPERVVQTVLSNSAAASYQQNQANFFKDFARQVNFAVKLSGHKAKPDVIATPSSSATPSLSPAEYLDRAAGAFENAHVALVQGLSGRKPVPAPLMEGTAYAGRGFFLSDPSGRVVSTYADQSVYPTLRFKPGSKSFLYAPTLLGANRSCIEVVTAYSSDPAAVWAWNWCSSVRKPSRTFVVNPAFITKYVRDFGSGVAQYTVQTSLLPDGKTWVAKLHNYQTGAWDPLFTASGQSQSEGGATGWDFFEEHAVLDSGNHSDYCQLLPPTFESTNIQISYDRKNFSKVTTSARALSQNALTCERLSFKIRDPYWHWTVNSGSSARSH